VRLIYYVGFSASIISLAAALVLFLYFRYSTPKHSVRALTTDTSAQSTVRTKILQIAVSIQHENFVYTSQMTFMFSTFLIISKIIVWAAAIDNIDCYVIVAFGYVLLLILRYSIMPAVFVLPSLRQNKDVVHDLWALCTTELFSLRVTDRRWCTYAWKVIPRLRFLVITQAISQTRLGDRGHRTIVAPRKRVKWLLLFFTHERIHNRKNSFDSRYCNLRSYSEMLTTQA